MSDDDLDRLDALADERDQYCPRCGGAGCNDCQQTGYPGGREP